MVANPSHFSLEANRERLLAQGQKGSCLQWHSRLRKGGKFLSGKQCYYKWSYLLHKGQGGKRMARQDKENKPRQ